MKAFRVLFVGLLVSAVLTSCSCGGHKRKKHKTRTGDLTVTGLNLGNQTVSPGTQDVPILWFQMQTNQAIVVVQSITFKADGTGDDAAHVDNVELWLDANNNGQADAGDTVLGSGTYAADNGTVTISCNRMIFSNTTESWLLTYDFNASASGTFTASIQNVETDVKATVGGNATQPSGGTITGATITISAGDLTVTVGPNPPSDSTVNPGSTNVPVLQFTLTAGSQDVTVVSVKIKASGTGDDAADISAVHLYHDANENGLYDSGETEIANGTYSADDGELTFTCNRTISANSSETWLVTYDFNASASGTYTASIQDITTDVVATVGGNPITPGGTSPINGATITVSPAQFTVEAGPAMPANQTIPPDQKNVPILQVKLSVPSGASSDITVISVTFTASGSGDDKNHIDAVKLYLDANENGQLDAGETQIDTDKQYSADDGTVTFSVNRTISVGSYEVYLLVYDFNASADGTFKASIADITTDVVAQDSGGNSVTPAGVSPIDGATITVSTAGPVVLSAELKEDSATQNGQGDAGETVVVTFDKDVVVNGSPDPNAVFNLPVTNDSFGTGATLAAGPNSNQVTITLGSGCVITATGLFDPANTNAGDPSGIDISNTMPNDAIEDAAGLDAKPSNPVDITCPYIPGQTVTGFAINALDPLGQQWGNVVVQYIVACDNASTNLSVTVEYYDGSQWKTATSAAGSDPLTNFNASEKGDLRIFVWDSYADMPNAGETSDYDKVMLRFTVTDGTDSQQDTAEVMLDNKPQVICGPDQVVNVGELVYVDAGRSIDPAGAALTYTFTLTSQPSGSAATLTTVDYLTSFTADVAGDYEIEVRVEAGGRTSDPLTVKITAVENKNVAGKLHLGNLNGTLPDDAQPQELTLNTSDGIGYYTMQFNALGYIDLTTTPAPSIYSTPTSGGLGVNYGGNVVYLFPSDVYFDATSAIAVFPTFGNSSATNESLIVFWAVSGVPPTIANASVGGLVFNGTGAMSFGVHGFTRQWTGDNGTVNNTVGYVGSNFTLQEYGSIDTTNANNASKLLSFAEQTTHIGRRVSCETQDHGNGLNAWVCVQNTPQNGVAIFNIDSVGEGPVPGTNPPQYNTGLNTITSFTWAQGWDTDDIPEDIWVDNANGKVWVVFQRSGENGGVCVIDCASQTVDLRYQIPLATDDAAPWRLLALQSDNVLLATDNDHDRVFVLRVDDWANPASVSLDYAIKVSKPYDLEYDTPRSRVLVTSPDNSDIYALTGPWSPDIDVVTSADTISSFAVAHHPRKAEIYLVYCEGTGANSAIKFTKSTDGGLTWSSPVELSQGPFTYVSDPDITVDHLGNIIVVWQSDGGVPVDGVYLTRSSDGGQTWETPVRCEPNGALGTTRRKDPAVTVDAAGNIVITYIVDDGSGNVQAAIMKSVGGQSWLYWGADNDNAVSSATDCSAPDVVVVPDASEPLGKVVATWHQGTATSAFYSYSVANRGWQPTGGAEAQVNHTTGNAVDGAVFVNGSLEPRFCWSDDTNATPNHDVYFGDGSSDVVIDNANGSDRAKVRLVFVSGTDYVYAAYIVDSKFIYWATSDDAGSSWTVEQLLFSDATRNEVVPLTNRTMTRMVLWLEELASGGTVIRFSRFR